MRLFALEVVLTLSYLEGYHRWSCFLSGIKPLLVVQDTTMCFSSLIDHLQSFLVVLLLLILSKLLILSLYMLRLSRLVLLPYFSKHWTGSPATTFLMKTWNFICGLNGRTIDYLNPLCTQDHMGIWIYNKHEPREYIEFNHVIFTKSYISFKDIYLFVTYTLYIVVTTIWFI